MLVVNDPDETLVSIEMALGGSDYLDSIAQLKEFDVIPITDDDGKYFLTLNQAITYHQKKIELAEQERQMSIKLLKELAGKIYSRDPVEV